MPYPIFSYKFLLAYLITMRPYLLFISGAAGLVGLAFIKETPPVCKIILVFIPLFLSYGFGQALTDCFQTDTDAISSPYRPLVQGQILKKHVLIFSLVGLAICVLLLTYLNPEILVLGFLAVIGLLTYTYFKRTWWGGPPWNAWIVAILPIMGRMVEIRTIGDLKELSFLLSIIAIFFGYANFVIMGYFKDISADKKTGYKTFPVVFGWWKACVYSDLTALVTATFTMGTLILTHNINPFGITIFIIALLINLYAQIKIHLIRDEDKTYGAITNVVRAFILYCLSIIVTLKIQWLIFITIFYCLFEITLRLRPEKTQV